MRKSKNTGLWIVAVLLAITGIFGAVTDSWTGIFLLLAGVCLIPTVKQKVVVKTRYQVMAVVLCFVLFGALSPPSEDGGVLPETDEPPAVSQLFEETSQASQAVDTQVEASTPETSSDAPVQSSSSQVPASASSPEPSSGAPAAPQTTPSSQAVQPTSSADDLQVHYINVGQADAIIIRLPNGQSVLIDGADFANGGTVLDYIRAQGFTRIDYLVATHPHADHIGGLPAIINALDIGAIYMPRVTHTTATFEALLRAVDNKGMTINSARAGVNIMSAEGLVIDIVAPVRDDYQDLNNHSAVIRVLYGSTAFLFTGDAEELSEEHITADISADVLKVGHHGSNTSTSQAFLNKVAPDYAIISVGVDNSYGHPTDAVLGRLKTAGADIYRTDEHGTIIVTSDGEGIQVRTVETTYRPNTAMLPADAARGSSSSSSSAASTPPSSVAPAQEVVKLKGGVYMNESMVLVTPLSDIDKFSVFWGNTGDRVHISPSCSTFRNGVLFGSLAEARAAERFEWCGTCSRTWRGTDGYGGDERFLRDGNPNIR